MEKCQDCVVQGLFGFFPKCRYASCGKAKPATEFTYGRTILYNVKWLYENAGLTDDLF